MVVIYKQSPSKLTDRRIDPWHYQPSFEKQINKIAKNLGNLSLESVIDSEHGVSSGATPLGANYLEKGRVRFYRTSEVEEMFLVSEEAVYITDEDDEKLKRSRLIEGDILLTITGAKFGKSAVVGADHLPGNISQHSVRFKPSSEKIDSHFLVAYLNCPTGQIAVWREAYGATRPAIDFPSIRALIIPKVELDAQKYIGNKVRQAEELRAWAKNQKSKLKALELQIPATKLDTSNSKVSLANLSFLTENRLDARYYSKKHLNLYSQFSSDFVSLGDICSGFKYGASIAANYVEQDGLPFIRGNALYANGINREDIVYLHRSMQKELKSAFVNEGDILITRSGTVGVATFVGSDYSKFWYGSFIIKCNLVSGKYIPEYISWFLNSWVGQQQFRRLENGAVQLNVNIEELNSIYVWDASDQFQTLVKQLIENEVSAINASKHLISIAKTLVEALIEGQLTEEQLIQAQQALEDSDNTLDKAILSKLSSEGYAVEGAAPLFSDIDELYRLLASANASADSED